MLVMAAPALAAPAAKLISKLDQRCSRGDQGTRNCTLWPTLFDQRPGASARNPFWVHVPELPRNRAALPPLPYRARHFIWLTHGTSQLGCDWLTHTAHMSA